MTKAAIVLILSALALVAAEPPKPKEADLTEAHKQAAAHAIEELQIGTAALANKEKETAQAQANESGMRLWYNSLHAAAENACQLMGQHLGVKPGVVGGVQFSDIAACIDSPKEAPAKPEKKEK